MAETFGIKDGVNIGLTTAQRDALTPQEGDTIYNTTDDEIQTYDGTQWNSVGGGGGGSQDLQSVLDEGAEADINTDYTLEAVTANNGRRAIEKAFDLSAFGFPSGFGIGMVNGVGNLTDLFNQTPSHGGGILTTYENDAGDETTSTSITSGKTIENTAFCRTVFDSDEDDEYYARLGVQEDFFNYTYLQIDSTDGGYYRDPWKEEGLHYFDDYSENGLANHGYRHIPDCGTVWNNGTTGNRPSSPLTGQRYFNTDKGVPEYYNGSSWVTGMGTQTVKKRLEIGAWDMDANGSIAVLHGLSATEYLTCTNISASILHDTDNIYDFSSAFRSGQSTDNHLRIDSSNFRITRAEDGFFDNTNFDDATMNRGFITFEYIPD